MKTFAEFIELKEAGAGVPYVGQSPGDGTWQGAAGGGKLASVGDVKGCKKHQKKNCKKCHK